MDHNAVTAGGPGLLTGDMGAQVSAVMDLAGAIRKAWNHVQASSGEDDDGGDGKQAAAPG